MRPFCLIVCLAQTSMALGSSSMQEGIAAVQDRRWEKALGIFVEALRQNPQNSQARRYINLIVKEIRSQGSMAVRDVRLEILASSARRLERNRADTRDIDKAILETTQAEEKARHERLRAQCEEAEIEMDLGRLAAAYSRVLGVLSEYQNHQPARQLLGELQSRAYRSLKSEAVSPVDHYALKGFYAYGEADYAEAHGAWKKCLALLNQNYSALDARRRRQALHLDPFFAHAESHVNQQVQKMKAQRLFNSAKSLTVKGRFNEALENLRTVAIIDPEFPQLGAYLVQAEAAAENERRRRWGEVRQRQIADLLESGVRALRAENYKAAEGSFMAILSMDSNHVTARSYLSIVQTEMHRRHDPKAAQMRYEAGLIAYASGKLEEAARDWAMAAKMNPGHPKAANALAKVRKELSLNHEVVP